MEGSATEGHLSEDDGEAEGLFSMIVGGRHAFDFEEGEEVQGIAFGIGMEEAELRVSRIPQLRALAVDAPVCLVAMGDLGGGVPEAMAEAGTKGIPKSPVKTFWTSR